MWARVPADLVGRMINGWAVGILRWAGHLCGCASGLTFKELNMQAIRYLALVIGVLLITMGWQTLSDAPLAHANPTPSPRSMEHRQAKALESIAKSLKAIERKKCD